MFFFSWFFGKSRATRKAAPPRDKLRDKLPASGARQGVSGEARRDDAAKTKTPDSREALYEAIRDVMTRSGILSASYKFKVLALDRQGSSHLVMVDLTSLGDDALVQPAELETLIVQRALTRYKMQVSAVYWRLNDQAVVHKRPSSATASAFSPLAGAGAQPPRPSQEPIAAEEITAFRRAMLAASARSAPDAPASNPKAGSGLTHAASPQGFEDTEVHPSAAYPVLSNTQYGDLH